jgi:hypothetical protein
MSEARHKTLLRKSIAACVAAIEIYNKPVMSYREEKRMRVDLNRAGNPKTIPLGVAIQRASQLPKLPLDPACAANIGSMVEIRDNGVHFFNSDPEVLRRVYEAGCRLHPVLRGRDRRMVRPGLKQLSLHDPATVLRGSDRACDGGPGSAVEAAGQPAGTTRPGQRESPDAGQQALFRRSAN